LGARIRSNPDFNDTSFLSRDDLVWSRQFIKITTTSHYYYYYLLEFSRPGRPDDPFETGHDGFVPPILILRPSIPRILGHSVRHTLRLNVTSIDPGFLQFFDQIVRLSRWDELVASGYDDHRRREPSIHDVHRVKIPRVRRVLTTQPGIERPGAQRRPGPDHSGIIGGHERISSVTVAVSSQIDALALHW